MLAVNPISRRRVVLLTSWAMCAGLVAVAIAFGFIPVDVSTLELETESISTTAIIVLVFIICFVFCYGVSMGNAAWMNTDLYPSEVRAIGTMWLACSCWVANIIVSSTFSSMMKILRPAEYLGSMQLFVGLSMS